MLQEVLFSARHHMISVVYGAEQQATERPEQGKVTMAAHLSPGWRLLCLAVMVMLVMWRADISMAH